MIFYVNFILRRTFRELFHLLLIIIGSFKKITDETITTLQRINIWHLILRSKPLKQNDADFDVEIISIVSHNDLILYLCMIKTFYFFSNITPQTTVLDDGTLSKIDINILNHFIPFIKVVSSDTANIIVANKFNKNKYPSALFLRNNSIYLKKKIDIPLICSKPRLLILDSDLLFYRKPKEIMDWIKKLKNGDGVIFMKDCRNSNIISEIESKVVMGRKLIPKLNSGIVGFPLKQWDPMFIEKFCKYIIENDIHLVRPHQMQTIWAAMFSILKPSERVYLSDKYILSEAKQSITNIDCRHFVRYVRPLFYKDAINLITYIFKKGRREVFF